MALDVACPQCGSRDARTARARSFGDRLRQLIGVYNLVCKRCEARYQGSLWNPRLLRYARCPKCLRTTLSTWSEHYYIPSRWTIFKLRIGASPYRCEWCRCNFASFRARKERFDWRKHRAPQPQAKAANET
jgi:DNA-directed RNA polymerase subunit RPC12/RpoP